MAIFRLVHEMLLALPRFRGRRRLLLLSLRFMRTARSVYGPVMEVDPGDFTNKACLLGYYGTELKDLIEKLPRDGVFLDFGANAGLYSLIADKHLAQGRVFSFEPSRPTFARLVRNLKLNGATRVVALNLGISRRTELVGFDVHARHSGGGRIVSEEQASETVLLLNSAEIVGVLGLNAETRCLAKIDTEGAELAILEALDACGLLDLVDCFYIEINEENLAGQNGSAAAIYDLLETHGFRPRTDRRGKAHYDEIFTKDALA